MLRAATWRAAAPAGAARRWMSVAPAASGVKKVTLEALQRQKGVQPWAMATAYDYPMAKAMDAVGSVDCILVGDSLGMVVLGYDSTAQVTMGDMVRHCAAVARGASRPLLVGDMPFGSYLTPQQGVENAARLIAEGGMNAVKLEGGAHQAPKISAIAGEGIPVIAHVGLTPQTSPLTSGYRLHGQSTAEASKLLDDALRVQDAGASAIVLEKIPSQLARFVTETLHIPTIGIGAGPHCDAQVLVAHDMLGLYPRLKPPFAKRYADLYTPMADALRTYAEEVRGRAFPPLGTDTDSWHTSWFKPGDGGTGGSGGGGSPAPHIIPATGGKPALVAAASAPPAAAPPPVAAAPPAASGVSVTYAYDWKHDAAAAFHAEAANRLTALHASAASSSPVAAGRLQRALQLLQGDLAVLKQREQQKAAAAASSGAASSSAPPSPQPPPPPSAGPSSSGPSSRQTSAAPSRSFSSRASSKPAAPESFATLFRRRVSGRSTAACAGFATSVAGRARTFSTTACAAAGRQGRKDAAPATAPVTRVAIVGSGALATLLAHYLGRVEGVAVTVCTNDLARAREMARHGGVRFAPLPAGVDTGAAAAAALGGDAGMPAPLVPVTTPVSVAYTGDSPHFRALRYALRKCDAPDAQQPLPDGLAGGDDAAVAAAVSEFAGARVTGAASGSAASSTVLIPPFETHIGMYDVVFVATKATSAVSAAAAALLLARGAGGRAAAATAAPSAASGANDEDARPFAGGGVIVPLLNGGFTLQYFHRLLQSLAPAPAVPVPATDDLPSWEYELHTFPGIFEGRKKLMGMPYRPTPATSSAGGRAPSNAEDDMCAHRPTDAVVESELTTLLSDLRPQQLLYGVSYSGAMQHIKSPVGVAPTAGLAFRETGRGRFVISAPDPEQLRRQQYRDLLLEAQADVARSTVAPSSVGVGHYAKQPALTSDVEDVREWLERKIGSKEVYAPVAGGPAASMTDIEHVAMLLRATGNVAQAHRPELQPAVEMTKVLANSVINPLGTIMGVPNGKIVDALTVYTGFARDLAGQAAWVANKVVPAAHMAEVLGIEKASPGETGPNEPGVSTMDTVMGLVMATALRTKGNECSMLSDLRRGAPSEVRFINGLIARHAELHGWKGANTHGDVCALFGQRDTLLRGKARSAFESQETDVVISGATNPMLAL